jgi:hypothetical protein
VKAFCALLLAAGLAWFGYSRFHPPITYPPGVLVGAEPEQWEVPAGTAPIAHGAYRLKPLAQYWIEARILHRENYHFDRPAQLAPTDLAVGWGPMSDQAVLDRVEISQSMRFYFYQYRNPPPIPQGEIARHSANMHIIPADDQIAAACKSFRAGELVRLEGQLVEATGPQIGIWRSSLRRDDTGNGACELFLVQKISRLEPDAVRALQPSSLVSR